MTPEALAHAVLQGDEVEPELLDTLSEDDQFRVVDLVIDSAAGRRWLHRYAWPDNTVPDRLVTYENDFRQQRRSLGLSMVVDLASEDALITHATAIAAGPAAVDLWTRFDSQPDAIESLATAVVASDDDVAAESTLYLVVLDELDQYRLGAERRQRIAVAALKSISADVRGLAAEYLATDAPAELLADFDLLVHDESERVRGIVWSSALQLARADARELAFAIIIDESVDLDIRRSALIASGTILPTTDLVDLLSLLVLHPNVELSSDAASLLYNQHRQPDIALAAQRSPHAHIREIAETLLDPLRGSPAAGGSRPGDPGQTNTADIYRDVIRQFEERTQKTDERV